MTAARDGVTLTLELDRPSVVVGEMIRATATVTNHSARAQIWNVHDCLVPVAVQLPPRDVPGRSWTGDAAAFKRRALAPRPARTEYFTPVKPREGDCVDHTRQVPLPRGAARTARLAWQAVVPDGGPPGDVARVTATYLLSTGSTRTQDSLRASLTLPVTTLPPSSPPPTGPGALTLGRALAVDAALADPAFSAYLRRHPLTPSTVVEVSLQDRAYWVGAYLVGVLAGYVQVDAFTGEIVNRVLA